MDNLVAEWLSRCEIGERISDNLHKKFVDSRCKDCYYSFGTFKMFKVTDTGQEYLEALGRCFIAKAHKGLASAIIDHLRGKEVFRLV